MKNKENIINTLFGFLIFYNMNPYFKWLYKPIYRVYFMCILLLIITCFFKKVKISNIEIRDIFKIIIYLMLSLYMIFSGDTLKISNVIIILYLAFSDNRKVEIFKKFKTIFSFSLIPGMIYWTLLLLGFIDLPGKIILPDSARTIFFYSYPGAIFIDNSVMVIGNNILIRLCGMMDEPGYIATFAALFLISDGFNLKKSENKILLISIFMTLSLAGFIVATIYLFLNVEIKKIITLLLIVSTFFFYFNDKKESYIYKKNDSTF